MTYKLEIAAFFVSLVLLTVAETILNSQSSKLITDGSLDQDVWTFYKTSLSQLKYQFFTRVSVFVSLCVFIAKYAAKRF